MNRLIFGAVVIISLSACSTGFGIWVTSQDNVRNCKYLGLVSAAAGEYELKDNIYNATLDASYKVENLNGDTGVIKSSTVSRYDNVANIQMAAYKCE